MSRLIDADELKRAFIGNRYGTKAIEYVIDEAPTVKAIPMGWISKYSRKPISNADYWAIMRMVTDWEKENEREIDKH